MYAPIMVGTWIGVTPRVSWKDAGAIQPPGVKIDGSPCSPAMFVFWAKTGAAAIAASVVRAESFHSGVSRQSAGCMVCPLGGETRREREPGHSGSRECHATAAPV